MDSGTEPPKDLETIDGQPVAENLQNGNASGESNDPVPPPSGDADAPVPAAKYIVIVDDDAAFTDGARLYFEDKGVRVQTFINKEQVMRCAFSQTPALLVIDMDFSGEDGRSLALDLWDSGKLKDCPTVLLTDTPMERDAVEFTLKLGFVKILQKPLDFQVLERFLSDEPRRRNTTSVLKSPITRRVEFVPPPPPISPTESTETPPTGIELKEDPSALPKATTSKSPATRITRQMPAPDPVPTVEDDQEPLSDSAIFTKGIMLGVVFSLLAATALAFAVSKGYAHSLVVLEGVLLGLAAGIGLKWGWKQITEAPNPFIATIAAGFAALVGWAGLLVIRAALDMPFVAHSAAVLQFIHDHPDAVRSWGITEGTAAGHILGQLIVTFILTMMFARSAVKAREPVPVKKRYDIH